MPLEKVIWDYWNHHESKSDGDIGELKRKHIFFDSSSIKYIGKESNELEESEIIGVSDDDYTVYEDLAEKARNLTNEDRKRLNIPKRRFYQLKKQKSAFQREGKIVRLLHDQKSSKPPRKTTKKEEI